MYLASNKNLCTVSCTCPLIHVLDQILSYTGWKVVDAYNKGAKPPRIISYISSLISFGQNGCDCRVSRRPGTALQAEGWQYFGCWRIVAIPASHHLMSRKWSTPSTLDHTKTHIEPFGDEDTNFPFSKPITRTVDRRLWRCYHFLWHDKTFLALSLFTDHETLNNNATWMIECWTTAWESCLI